MSRRSMASLMLAALCLGGSMLIGCSHAAAGDSSLHDTSTFDRQALARVAMPPLGLPAVPVPAANPLREHALIGDHEGAPDSRIVRRKRRWMEQPPHCQRLGAPPCPGMIGIERGKGGHENAELRARPRSSHRPASG